MNRKINIITILNIISTFILQGIAFITTPIFTRLLGNSQFGMYSLYNSWVLILTCIMGLSMHSSIGTGLYTYKDKYILFRNSILLSSTLICLFEMIPIIIFSNKISIILGFNNIVVVLIGLTAFAHYIVNFAQMVFIYEKKAVSNFILSVTISIISVVFSIILIYNFDNNSSYIARIYGMTITYIIAALILWFVLYLKKPVLLKKEYTLYGLTVGVPIVFHSLSQQILGQSDRVMMQFFKISTAEIGIYSLFYTLSSVLSTLLSALNNSWCPFYYDDVNEKKWSTVNEKCSNYIELFTVLSVGFLLLSREVSLLMADKSYSEGVNVLPILTIAIYFTFMYQFPVNFEFYYKKTNIIALGTIGAGLLNIVLNFIMIPLWGMYGAAVATAISYLGLFFVHYYIVTHIKNIVFHLKFKMFIPGLICLAIGFVAFYILKPWWYIRWGCGLILGAVELYKIFKRKSIF